jgi:hypothetical protein
MPATAKVRERGILFSAPMAKALLDGRKTQTRRVVRGVFKAPPPIDADCIKDWDGGPSRLDLAPRDWEICPHGVPGDRLWVRETAWFPPPITIHMAREGADTWPKVIHGDDEADWCREHGWSHRSSRSMPRWASRITLEITEVRVERLQSIDTTDAFAEGVGDFFRGVYFPGYLEWTAARANFRRHWDSINGKRPGCSWADNPWVWCVSFKRLDGKGEFDG